MTLTPGFVSAQVSGLGVAVTPAFDSPVVVGEQDQPAMIQLVNNSFGPQAAVETVTVSNLEVNTSCAVSVVDPTGASPCPTPEPRSFNDAILLLDPTSTPGTTCPGGPFTITAVDGEGNFTITPTSGPVTLGPVGQPGSSCIIAFTFDVIQRPNDGSTFQVVRAVATSPTFPGGSPQTGVSIVTVNQATPSIATLVSVPGGGPVPVGTTFTDTASVTGMANPPFPTGAVTFTVFHDPPGAAPCSGTPTNLGFSPLTSPGELPTRRATSAPVTATLPGTYRFVATYSGDVNYAALGPTPCDAPGENVTVVQLVATLATQASTNATNVPPGTPVTDLATLTPPPGGPAPTGTVTYTLVGPNPDPACTGPVVGTSTVLMGSPSAPFNPTLPGTYNFVATYSGDGFYAPITTPVGCGDPAERFAIPPQPVTLTTQASTNSTTVMPGTAVSDLATVTPPAGFPAPTGTVTYTLVGPNPGAACTAPVVGTSTVPVGQPSGPFTVNALGTYNFVATYSGDANYLPITTPIGCNDPAERFAVATVPVGFTTQASTNSSNVAPGTVVSDLAVFTPPPSGPPPTGTVTYALVGPNPNATCTAPVFGPPSTAPVGQPSAPYAPTAPGTYNFVATYSGDANYSPITTPVGCGDPNEIFALALQPLTVTTQASTNSTTVAPGTAVTDIATFTPSAGGPAPTGTVTYTLVGPNPDQACTGPLVGTSTVPVGSSSAPVTVTVPGTYNFVATYSGDGFYAPITTPVGCGDPAERFAIPPQPVTLTTQASTNSTAVMPGTAATDLATVTPPPGGPAPTGTVTYTLVGPNPNANCTAPVVGTSTVSVGQPSGPFTVNAVGTYNFVATYSGDANYLPITTAVGCNDPAERFGVTPAPISIVTRASPAVDVGGQITDTATLSGGVNPTGTITFTLFGPDNPTCTGTPILTSTVPVNGNGDYQSDPFTITAAGTYHWIASYSGDTVNAPAGPTACADPLEQTVGRRVSPQLVTVASAGNVGSQVFDTATLSSGFNPTGTITFELFGPNDDDCSGPPTFTSVKPVTGNGSVVSDPFIVPEPGVYHFVATYSGDHNNEQIGPTACDDLNETVAADRAPSSLSTVASPSVPVGGVVFDIATLSAGFNPTGTITFNLYGPDDDCSGPPVFTSVVPVNGNGAYTSPPFTPTVPGTYQWVAAYSGDANNMPAATACADPLGQVVVTPRPLVVVDKTATPASLPVPGGIFTFSVVVTNPGMVPVSIMSLTDDVYGDITARPGSTCNAAVGTVLAPSPGPGNIYTCTFQAEFRGPSGATQVDVVTVRATDAGGNLVSDSDDAVVRIRPAPPSIVTTKGATPPTLPEPGGSFTFNYSVTNTGSEPVTITAIVDDVYGNLDARGTCAVGVRLAGGGFYVCTFTGTFFGNARARQTDTIITTAVDDRGQSVTSRAEATVTLTDTAPSIRVVKELNPAVIAEPGGASTVTVTVTNASLEPVTLTALTDDVHGNLNARGTCAVGVRLPPVNGTYTCFFPTNFFGDAGSSQTDTVTATVVDDEGTSTSAAHSASVRITDVPPTVRVDKQPLNPTLPAPGGDFVYRVVVTNTSFERVTIVSLADQPAALGNCVGGVTIAPNGGTYTCEFVRTFTGGVGASETDRVTVVVVDNDGSRAVAHDDATVTITAASSRDEGINISTTTAVPSTTTTRPPVVTFPPTVPTSVTPTTRVSAQIAPLPTATATATTAAQAPPTAPPVVITAPALVTTTAVPSPTTVAPTTTAPTSTTSPPTPTTVPPATTAPIPTTPTTPPPGDAATLDAVSPHGVRSGPPGVGLDVSGGGYGGCRRVYVFFDGVRIGTVDPDDAGFIGVGDLSVPGDADPGEHRVSSSCSASGGPVRAAITFAVIDADFHRTGFATSLPRPDQISLDMERILASAAVAGLVILLFAFPSKLFNSAVEENYDEIRGWFRMPARAVDASSTTWRTVTFFGLSVVAAIALGFLSPDFGLNLNSLVLVAAFTVSLIVMSAGWSIPAAVGIHRRTGEWGKLNFLPGTLLVSIVMVIICRLLKIQPGYFYGALAGIAFASALNQKTQGRLVAANWTWALALSLTSWFLRMPVSEAAAQPDANVLWIGVEAFLVMTFLWGVESLAVAMLPMRFLDGPKVKAWNLPAWAVLLFVGVFATVHVLLTPTAGYVGQTTEEVTWDVLIIFAIFAAFSLAVWAYFRYRPERWIPRVAPRA